MTKRIYLALSHLIADIRFWLLLLLLIRLVGITNAPLETGHNWRQSLTNMISRNFVEIGPEWLYPRVDIAGASSGIIGSEFPLFNYLIYLCCMLFGYEHWYGRLVNLVVSTLGLYFFYRLLSELANKRLASSSTLVLGVSIWFAFSRKIMPDTFSVSLVLMGLFYAMRYVKTGRRWPLALFWLLSTLGMLCKIPSSALLAALVAVFFVKTVPVRRMLYLSAAVFLAALPVAAWYFVWVPHLVETYGFQLYFPKGLQEGLQEIIPFWPQFFEKFYFSALHSYLALACCAAGLWILFKTYSLQWWLALGAVTTVFAFFILKTGAVFPLHNYYIIPLVPLMAVVSGMALTKLSSNYRLFLLVLIAVEAIANQQHDFFIKTDQLYKLSLEALVNQYIPSNERIVINGGQSPQDMYFAHRKGWSITNEELQRRSVTDSLALLGAKYLVVDHHTHGAAPEVYLPLHRDAHYGIYQLFSEKAADMH